VGAHSRQGAARRGKQNFGPAETALRRLTTRSLERHAACGTKHPMCTHWASAVARSFARSTRSPRFWVRIR
jgi:hypothetical protein